MCNYRTSIFITPAKSNIRLIWDTLFEKNRGSWLDLAEKMGLSMSSLGGAQDDILALVRKICRQNNQTGVQGCYRH